MIFARFGHVSRKHFFNAIWTHQNHFLIDPNEERAYAAACSCLEKKHCSPHLFSERSTFLCSRTQKLKISEVGKQIVIKSRGAMLVCHTTAVVMCCHNIVAIQTEPMHSVFFDEALAERWGALHPSAFMPEKNVVWTSSLCWGFWASYRTNQWRYCKNHSVYYEIEFILFKGHLSVQ